mmetsp:Transcript_82121/g.232460  ORF Transcript_82121/g.232460 Transcript_82121/m.232460 type:complete len:257 (+) Transcript_82121:649-1419(+)
MVQEPPDNLNKDQNLPVVLDGCITLDQRWRHRASPAIFHHQAESMWGLTVYKDDVLLFLGPHASRQARRLPRQFILQDATVELLRGKRPDCRSHSVLAVQGGVRACSFGTSFQYPFNEWHFQRVDIRFAHVLLRYYRAKLLVIANDHDAVLRQKARQHHVGLAGLRSFVHDDRGEGHRASHLRHFPLRERRVKESRGTSRDNHPAPPQNFHLPALVRFVVLLLRDRVDRVRRQPALQGPDVGRVFGLVVQTEFLQF